MGKKAAAVICGTASLLGLLAAILGFVGEGTKSQSFAGFDGVHCVYRSTAARGCGVTATLFLLAAQVLLAAATGCSGCCRPETRKIPSETKRVFAVAMYIDPDVHRGGAVLHRRDLEHGREAEAGGRDQRRRGLLRAANWGVRHRVRAVPHRRRLRHRLLLPARSVGAATGAAAGDRPGAAAALLPGAAPAPRRLSGRCHLADTRM
ncbi:hypothetical protein CFC21_099126, partial [Triticum aestivum]